MKNLENEYRNRFKAQETPVGETDSDDLWAAISSELDADGATPPPQRDTSGGYYKVAFFALLVLIGSFGLFHTLRDTPTHAPSNMSVASENIGEQKTPSRPNASPQNAQSVTPTTQATEVEVSVPTHSSDWFHKASPGLVETEKTGKADVSKTQGNERFSQNSAHSTVESQELDNTALPKTSGQQKTNTPDRTKRPSEHSTTETPAAQDAEHTAQMGHRSPDTWPVSVTDVVAAVSPSKVVLATQTLEAIAKRPISPIKTLLENPLRPDLLPFANFAEDKGKKKKRSPCEWQISADAGANLSLFRFSATNQADLAAQKSEAEIPGLGSSVALRTHLLWHQRWSFSTGLEYHQFQTAFSAEQEDNIKVFKTNQLLRIFVNSMTGDTLKKIYGDTLINAVSTRMVWHNNSFQQIGIPLEIGIRRAAGKWFWGGGIGAVLALTTVQSGKTLDDKGTIITFETADAAAPFAKIGVGLRASPVIGYQLNENWAMTLRPQWTWQQNKALFDTDLQMNAHAFSLNLGLQYSIR